ncbi:MAG: AraC family transcriptional regulator [Clostridium sp.]|uniref:AraC family transcriptional regulator n=1 Tax=Clostridium sp. TaxID=1506 RepID=UPI003F2BB1A6
MNNITYEKVNLNPNIPALLVYFGKENISDERCLYIPSHWHRSIEMTLIINGEVSATINGKNYIVKDGEFTFINSGDVHELKKNSKAPCSGVILILSYDFIKKIYPDIDNIQFDVMGTNKHNGKLHEIFLNLKELYLNQSELDYIKINSYIYEVLYILLKNYRTLKSEDNTGNYFKYKERQKDILTYISENYSEDLTLERISKHFYMSSDYFSRKFHEWFGVTYKVHLNNFRLYKAYEDVATTAYSIQDIAYSHGFSNVKSFIITFKDKYNMTPLKYRQYLNESKNNNKLNKK